MKPEDVLHSFGKKFGQLKGGNASANRRSGRFSSDPDDDYEDEYDDYAGDDGQDGDDYEDDDHSSGSRYDDSDDGLYDASSDDRYDSSDDDLYDASGDDRYDDSDDDRPYEESYDSPEGDDDAYNQEYEEAFEEREERYRARHREALERRQRQLRQRILIVAAVVAVLVIILVIIARSGRSGESSAADSSALSTESAALSGTTSALSGTISTSESASSQAEVSDSQNSSVSAYTSYAQDQMPAVALTFDDGPRSGNTDAILDVLEQYNAHATFFVLGENCEANADTLKRAVSLGCEIGSHTWDHEQLTKLSADERQSEYTKAAEAIEQYAGVTPSLIRPPYGSDNSEIREELDIPIILWELDTLDWKTKDADATYDVIDQDLQEGDIVLMHDIHESTVEAVPKIVPMLVNKGYKLLTVTELYDYYGEDLTLHINHAYSGPVKNRSEASESTASTASSNSSD